jgi:hypothetical protein
MATKSTGVVLAFLAILTVLTVPSGVLGLQQQIAFAQGVEDSEGGEEIPFDDVKVVDGEEVIEVGSEGGGEEETGNDDFSLQSIFEFLAQFVDLGDDEGEDGDEEEQEENDDQNNNNQGQQGDDTTRTLTQSQSERNVIVDRDTQ